MKKYTKNKKGLCFIPNSNKIREIRREDYYDFAYYVSEDETNNKSVPCLLCKNKYCLSFYEHPDILPIDKNVCPTNSIYLNKENQITINTDKCIKCGLCVFRCIYGAIKFNNHNYPVINNLADNHIKVNIDEFDVYFQRIKIINDINIISKRRILKNIFSEISNLKQDTFYPLIGSLLNYLEYQTTITRSGDTSNRMDGIIIDPEESIPLEIKSPTETEIHDTKSIRQALENKIVLLSRKPYKTKNNTTSLSLALKYPNIRSDIYELIDDIYSSYNINIGILSLIDIYKIIINKDKLKNIKKLRGNYY